MRMLRSGYTTGACAAAAAKGAALTLRDGAPAGEAELTLPRGEKVRFRIEGGRLRDHTASCYVVKDAGDDPDVTNGAEIHAAVTRIAGPPRIVIEGGTGVGRVTKPGLAVPPGEWAINPVPRRMIAAAVTEVFGSLPCALRVVISIPNGVELARKTLNARLGILGGLSILGTTGIVRPVSAEAWTATIDASVDVARAAGCATIVLSTGRSSEQAAQNRLAEREPGRFPEEAFVMMGDHVGYALDSCEQRGVPEVIVAGQFAKLLKIACGHADTHVRASQLDLETLARWLEEAGEAELASLTRQCATAREVLDRSGNDPALVRLVIAHTTREIQGKAPRLFVQVFLAGYNGEMI